MNFAPTIRVLRILSAALFLFAAVYPAFSQAGQPAAADGSPLPPPSGHVNDYVGVFDDASRQQLEERLRSFKAATGVEIAVVVVATTGGNDIYDYSMAVARGWKIGSDQDDNPGALLLVAIDDRKYFTQISRDLEDEIPDGLAGSLQRQYLVPEFRKGNYAKGISDTIEAYIAAYETRGTTPAPTPAGRTVDDKRTIPWFSVFCCLAVILFIVLVIWSNRSPKGKSKRDHDRWGGGFGGGGALPWIILGGSGGSSSDSSSSWDWGGGGGGSDWGGFGGGGDFGGGGAGGGW